MFKKLIARPFAVAAIAAACAVPAFAQLQVANSTGGSQVALAPINAIVSTLNSNIWSAQNTANVANNVANVANNAAWNAQSTANNANAVAQNAQATADKGVYYGDAAWWYAWEAASASCAATMGGAMWRPYCEAQQRPHP
ncbi:hypothetical protein [Variovorax ginsengisoli]|uniref:Uncharacterized protein n=1 Tax=Variovorax ginsengisoli TaxID=363844 RepID=A0ABT8S9T4_9BURK|nr:hypothetical protein [Variovorax ginsengisoli]MDN8616509.1 hypothetical protein [Variovorax ginsengisoli]MDO1535679.1 hypothetical protein [Variovorax ginsengisoli]